MNTLSVRNLSSTVYDSTEEKYTEILKGVDLDIGPGETHILMGSNGSGKSTLAHVLTGHHLHKATDGSAELEGEDLLGMSADERARAGLFLAFQYPTAIPGLPVATFLKKAAEAFRGREIPVAEFQKELRPSMEELNIPPSFLNRFINDGFSGGEKKRMEILQYKLLEPKLGILDETDSGLDIDALKLIFENISASRGENNSLLIITHYERVLEYITPDAVHLMKEGRIVRSGGTELSTAVHERGLEAVVQ